MNLRKTIIATLACMAAAMPLAAQQTGSKATLRKGGATRSRTEAKAEISPRMEQHFSTSDPLAATLSDADLQYVRVIYRDIDLNRDENAVLYFPEQVTDGNENLFRIIMRLLASGQIKAYEYLDGREVFTPEYETKVKDILDRFYISYTPAKGSTDKNPKFNIDEADVPSNEVLTYYIIERWVYDTRYNRLRPSVDAICPVLHRSGDFGGDAVRYPMFWVKYGDIRPWLKAQPVFLSDHNNLPTSTYDDYFINTQYKGTIYKTRNLRNRSLAQQFPDADDRRRAQDSIQASLDNFEKRLWTPTRGELEAIRLRNDSIEAAKAPAAADKSDEKEKAPRSVRGNARSNRPSVKKKAESSAVKESQASRSSSATRSVRRRR